MWAADMMWESNHLFRANIYIQVSTHFIKYQNNLARADHTPETRKTPQHARWVGFEDIYGAIMERIKAQDKYKSRLGMGALM